MPSSGKESQGAQARGIGEGCGINSTDPSASTGEYQEGRNPLSHKVQGGKNSQEMTQILNIHYRRGEVVYIGVFGGEKRLGLASL